MEIEEQWKKLQEQIREISSLLNPKGYVGVFQTAGAYLDNLEKSINRYAFASVMGDEPGFKNGFSLKTYVLYQKRGDNITVHFKVSPRYQNMLMVREVEIEKWDSRQWKFMNIRFSPTDNQEIPSQSEAIKMVNPESK